MEIIWLVILDITYHLRLWGADISGIRARAPEILYEFQHYVLQNDKQIIYDIRDRNAKKTSSRRRRSQYVDPIKYRIHKFFQARLFLASALSTIITGGTISLCLV